jgi:hypothetical protein
MCLNQGRVTEAKVADHIVPHKGDLLLFYNGALQSLCESHHNRTKKQLELHGYTHEVGEDGWPAHPLHPSNRTRVGAADKNKK